MHPSPPKPPPRKAGIRSPLSKYAIGIGIVVVLGLGVFSLSALIGSDDDAATTSATSDSTRPASTTRASAAGCAPDWVLDPSGSQFANAAVRVTAQGFTPDSPITFTLGEGRPVFAQTQADAAGTFDTFVNLPDVAAGDYVFIGEDNDDCKIGEPFTVERTRALDDCGPLDWEVDPGNSQFAGGAVRMTGEGFTPNALVTFHLGIAPFAADNDPFAHVRADAAGNIDAAANLPDVPAGEYVIAASDTTFANCIIGRPFTIERTDTTATTATTQAADSTGPDVSLVTWTVPEIEELPESGAPTCAGAPQVIIQATVTDPSGVATVRLTYEVGTVNETVDMTLGGGTYNAGIGPLDSTTIAGFGNSETIELVVTATDAVGNVTTLSPSGGPVLNNCGTA